MVRLFPTEKGRAMSTTRIETRRWGPAGAAAAVLLFAAAGLAQPPGGQDYLDQVRRREEVARQKVETEVRDGLRDVQKITASNPAGAVERLKGLLTLLESDTALAQDRRDRLQRMVKDRIRVTEQEKDAAAAAPAPKDDKAAAAAARRLLDEQLAAERERLRKEMEALRQQRQQGADTGKQAADVARRNPTNPAAQAGSRINSAADQMSAARRAEIDRQRGLAGVRRDVDRSSTPPAGDMEFPKDWAERTKGRVVGKPLTPKEKAILTALSTPVLVNFKNSRFDDVVEYLSTLTGQPIVIDPTALKEAEVTYETPVTLNAKGVQVRTALRTILAELNLAYLIKDETIQITTLQRARETMVVHTYPVADLVVAFRPDRPFFAPPFALPEELFLNAKDLVQMIQASVDPASWQVNGGLGTIVFHAPSMSLVVKQTAEVHMMLGRSPGSK
jgi:hypothetical protein